MTTTTTTTTTAIRSQSKAGLLASIALMALLGATLTVVAGLAQSATLHDAAHDMRHATGFPCH